MIFTLEQKMAALAMRFYQRRPWEPKVGDYYCLTREGVELFIINRTDGESFYIRRVYAPDQPEGDEMSDPWPIESFQSGFGENRVWVHPVILGSGSASEKTTANYETEISSHSREEG